MSAPKKPMLACDAPPVIRFPVYASPKLDGIRCTVWHGVPLSRSLKAIPNAHINAVFAARDFGATVDGELIVGSPTAPDVYRRTTSGVMSKEGTPAFTFFVFDVVDNWPYSDRLAYLAGYLGAMTTEDHGLDVRLLPQVLIHNEAELLAYEAEQLALGYEGVILRDTNASYKHGRSTAKEGALLKVKRFTDSEAVIIGAEELMHNSNEAFENELGHTARSTAKAGLVPSGKLGALICETADGVEFRIGTGFTDAMRVELWQKPLAGLLAKFKHFEVGAKDAPRHPVFLGFRDRLDLDPLI